MTAAVPVLPEAEVRAAMHAEQWDIAFGLLADHDRDLRQALESVELTKTSAAPWRELLERQTALLQDLSVVRDETAAILARMGRERRGALAYRTLAG